MIMISWTKEKNTDIKYKVEQKDRTCIIYVKCGQEIRTQTYECEFPVVCGYDAVDMANIESILDGMINKMKENKQ